MDSAIHKKTGKEYLAWFIWKQGLFESKDVHDEEWIAPSDEIENYEELKEEIPVTPTISYYKPTKNIYIGSFFKLKPGYSDRVIFKKESELHKKLKSIIAVLLTEEFNCSLRYDKDIYFIKNLPIDFQRLQENIKKMEVRKNITSTNEYRTADVLIPFIFNPFWGNGIAIEIRVSEKEDTEEEKENFWFQRGYSVIWVNEEDFGTEDGRIGLNKNILNVIPFSIGYKRILDNHIDEMQSYLHEGWENLEEEKREIVSLMKQLNDMKLNFLKDLNAELEPLRKTCRTCRHGRIDSRNNNLIACWLHTYRTRNGKNAPSKHEQLDSCGHYENC
jgi:hypothetical protein